MGLVPQKNLEQVPHLLIPHLFMELNVLAVVAWDATHADDFDVISRRPCKHGGGGELLVCDHNAVHSARAPLVVLHVKSRQPQIELVGWVWSLTC